MTENQKAPRVCGFCHGGPVGNAATWVDGKHRPPAPCPRCGQTNTDSAALLAAWEKLSGERSALQGDMRAHGANSLARQRLMRLDSILSGKLLAIGDELRGRGIDPNCKERER